MKSFLVHVTYQLIISLALLWFAWSIQSDTLTTVIVTAVVTHWLKESVQMGKTASTDLKAQRANGTS